MATIRNSIALQDRMTPVLKSVIRALQSSCAAMAGVDQVSNKAFNNMQSDVMRASNALNQLSSKANATENTTKNMFNNIGRSSGGAISKIQSIAAGIYSIKSAAQGLSIFTNMSDGAALTRARLDLINDGLQTTEELQNRIMDAANRSRISYVDLGKSVSKLGLLARDAFNNTAEIEKFSELMGRSFKVGGADQSEQSAGMYQLTQAMAAGKLQGDEFRSITENAPMLAQAIADFTGKSMGQLKDMSAQGLITADVIKGALFRSADDINKKFETLPMTWADAFTIFKNKVQVALRPVLDKLSEMANDQGFQQFISGVIGAVAFAGNVVLNLMSIIGELGGLISQNWSWISPVIMGVVGSLLIYKGVMTAINIVEGISKGIKYALVGASYAKAFATGTEVTATTTATAAQWGLNTAMYACPLTWIILLIVGLIALIYLVVGAINKVTGSTISATGVIIGYFSVVGSFIWNKILSLVDLVMGVINGFINPFIMFANFVGNFLTSPVSSIVYLFQGMADNVLGILENIANALDKIFGSDMSGAIAGWRSGLKGAADQLVADIAPEEDYKEVVSKLNLSTDTFGLDRIKYSDAWQNGYKLGEKIDSTIGSFDPNKLFNDNFLPKPEDYNKFKVDGGKIDEIGKINGDVSITDEDIKMLKDIASVEYINKFTTLKPNVNVNFGDVHETADVNKIAEIVEEMVVNAYATNLT